MPRLALLIAFFIPILSYTQPVNLSDSLLSYMSKEPRLSIRLDTRNSFITGRSAQIRGVKAGVTFGERLSFGLGYNWLRRGFQEEITFGPQGEEVTYLGELHFSFLSPYAEYVFYDRNGFSVAVPVQLGFGASWISYKDENDQKLRSDRKFIMLYEPAMTIEQRIFKYFAIGGGIGYRLMLKGNPDVNARLTSPIYLIRFRLLFSEVLHDVAPELDTRD